MWTWFDGLALGTPKKHGASRDNKLTRLQKPDPHSPQPARVGLVARIKKNVFVYISYFLSELLHERFKFLYKLKRQVLCIFECAKI